MSAGLTLLPGPSHACCQVSCQSGSDIGICVGCDSVADVDRWQNSARNTHCEMSIRTVSMYTVCGVLNCSDTLSLIECELWIHGVRPW